ncbi:thermosome subunit [Candidatus Pacearchaeota archaeon]|nr:MAG: thermosome subunit [Candidatus Pacearchaeota archaeon]
MTNDEVGVISKEALRKLGRDAQRNNLLAAKLVADIVRTTLGPKGMDKMLVDSAGEITITNDGATILDSIALEHPVAKLLVRLAKSQEEEVGDGTTTSVLLAGELLARAENLLDKRIHPTTIAKGYKLASDKAIELLSENSFTISTLDELKKIAMTAMTGKIAENYKDKLANLVVEAANVISDGKEFSLDDVKIVKFSGGAIEQSSLVRGVVLDKERPNKSMPARVENARVLALDFPLEVRSPETQARISVSTPDELEAFLKSEERYLGELVGKIRDSGAKAVFCLRGIDELAQYLLAKSNILALRRVPRSDLERIARACKARIVSSEADISPEVLGKCELVEERQEGEEKFVVVRTGEESRYATIVLRGGTQHVLDEIERAVIDGLSDVRVVVRHSHFVCGGGAIEIELARQLREFAKNFEGREQLSIEEFANALESIPETLAENAGLDPLEIVTQLRKAHNQGQTKLGINILSSKIEDMLEAGVIEPAKVKSQAISSASEFASLVLRIDDVLMHEKKSEEKFEVE